MREGGTIRICTCSGVSRVVTRPVFRSYKAAPIIRWQQREHGLSHPSSRLLKTRHPAWRGMVLLRPPSMIFGEWLLMSRHRDAPRCSLCSMNQNRGNGKPMTIY